MEYRSKRRQRARRLRFEGLEKRCLLTSVLGSPEWTSGDVASAVNLGSIESQVARADLANAEGESTNSPALVGPLEGAVLDIQSVTLEFEPIPGYTGDYLVRLEDRNWNGRQAAGFQHDSPDHYLSISTRSSHITVPVEAGEQYRWWVHRPGHAAAGAGFSVAADAAPLPDTPTLISPLPGDVIEGRSVTLVFEPLPGYTGSYYVRLDDAHWGGQQASEFQHDSDRHYLSITTKSTSITVPVEPGEEYSWWVHKPGFAAARASFSVAEDHTPSIDMPAIVSPLEGDEVDGRSVTLQFEPLPGYSGNYYVRLEDAHWDGRQASGFQHDSDRHYLSITTKSTSITVPVEAGEDYSWWVHRPGFPAYRASFSVAENDTPSLDTPTLVSPLEGDLIESQSVTLEFEPLPGYTGNYLVRLHDANWDGRQASGFQHDSTLHYLSISTKSTRITLPVKPGASYRWWVHKPGLPAASAKFTVAPGSTPISNTPTLVQPLQGDVIQDAKVTLEFEPIPGYTGNYLVRLNDTHWNGQQVPGFQHDSTLHYLSISTKSTHITVPVELGEDYTWWVHRPGFPAAGAAFSIASLELRDPELVDGRYRCTALEPWEGTSVDVSPILQYCIDQTPIDATLELPAGEYRLSHQVVVDRRIVVTSVGKNWDDPPVTPESADAAHLIANPDLNEPFGLLYLSDIKGMHHVIIDGNKASRLGTAAHQRILDTHLTRYGFNALLECDDVRLVGNVFQNALAGSGLGVKGSRRNLLIEDNKFLDNGFHTEWLLWADGLTVHDVADSQIVGNEFRDNTDIDLIFGGAQNSVITNNTILHTADPAGGAFAGLMIHKWANSTGNYAGSEFSGNVVDGGPNRRIGSGIYVASEGWYSETPYGHAATNPIRSVIRDNVVKNVLNGMYVGARGFSIYANQYEKAHGVTFPSSNGPLSSNAPIVVSPTSTDIDFHNENVDPATRHLFESQSWIGCIPNWPF